MSTDWNLKTIEPLSKRQEDFYLSVERMIKSSNKSNDGVLAVARMVQNLSKIFNSRIRDPRNWFDIVSRVSGPKKITVIFKTTFNSKEIFQIINTK